MSRRLILCRHGKHHMKRGASAVHRLSFAPGFSGVVEDFQQRFILFFIIREYRMGVRNEEDVAFGGKPLEISKTFPKASQLCPKYSGKDSACANSSKRPDVVRHFLPSIVRIRNPAGAVTIVVAALPRGKTRSPDHGGDDVLRWVWRGSFTGIGCSLTAVSVN